MRGLSIGSSSYHRRRVFFDTHVARQDGEVAPLAEVGETAPKLISSSPTQFFSSILYFSPFPNNGHRLETSPSVEIESKIPHLGVENLGSDLTSFYLF